MHALWKKVRNIVQNLTKCFKWWENINMSWFFRIRFGKVALRCRDCRATTHAECKDLVPLPCVPAGNTPTLRGGTVRLEKIIFLYWNNSKHVIVFWIFYFFQGTIADYTPMIPPMVPSLVVHCINEIELRGMSEQGLYRISGGSNDVKLLKEKFLRGRGAPNLSEVDVNTICSTLKDFLRWITNHYFETIKIKTRN